MSTVKGISVSSTRQLTVGMMKELERCGTPWKPSSRNGTSNSRFWSLQMSKGERKRWSSQQKKVSAHFKVIYARFASSVNPPIVALPDVLLDTLHKLVELPIDLVAPLSLPLLLLDLVGVVPAVRIENR